MRDRIVKFLATGCGAGLVPVAPGTAGSLVGLVYWWLLIRIDQSRLYWVVVLCGIAVAMLVAGSAARLMNVRDPESVVIDEIAAVPLALAGIPMVWWQLALGFLLFRLFDIWKPPPVRQSQQLPGGFGIVIDDVIAGAYACAGTHLVIWLVTRAGG